MCVYIYIYIISVTTRGVQRCAKTMTTRPLSRGNDPPHTYKQLKTHIHIYIYIYTRISLSLYLSIYLSHSLSLSIYIYIYNRAPDSLPRPLRALTPGQISFLFEGTFK